MLSFRTFMSSAFCLVLTLSLLSGSAAAQAVDATRADELVKQSLQRYAEGLLGAERQTPPVTPPSAPASTYPLTLDNAVTLAMEHNLDIAVERLNPQTYDLQIAGLLANYRPTLTSTFGQRNQVLLPTSQLNGGVLVNNDTLTYSGGIAQNIPWGGGSLTAGFNNTRLGTNNLFANFNPQYQSAFTATYTQPLLRNFRIDNTRQQLKVTRINQDISEVQLRAQITNTLSSVRSTYWDLVYAVQAVEVVRQSLALAEKLVEDNRIRVEIGTMAPIDIVQAQAEAATRRQALTQAEAAARTSELALKRLIVSGTDDPLWRAALIPTDRPDLGSASIDVEAAVRTALEKRTDLTTARRQLESNDISLTGLRDAALPAVDLVASYGMQGLGGTSFIRQGSGLGSTIIGAIPGGYTDALSTLFGHKYPNWNLTLNISYPIGTSAAQAQVARANVQKSQSLAQLRALELQVATEVTNAALQVQSNLKRIDASAAARELQQRRLEAEQSKFEVGMSTNFLVVQAQRDLTDAQNAELRALLDYRKSLVDFERVQETSLSRAGITVVTGATGGGGAAAAGRTGGAGGGGQGQ